MEQIKKIMKKLWFGVCMGSYAFAAMIIIASLISGKEGVLGEFQSLRDYANLALSIIFIAIGFSLPTIIYDNERLSMTLQILVHMIIGSTTFVIISFISGWIEMSVSAIILYIVITIIVAIVIWVIYMFCFNKEVKKINDKIQKKK